MFVNQLSVFINNQQGTIADVISILGENGINLKAVSVSDRAEYGLSIADTSDYGILRLIVDKPEEALELLKKSEYKVKIAKTIGIIVNSNNPNELAKILTIIKNNNIEITYIYSYGKVSECKDAVIIKTQELEKTVELLKNNGIELVNNL